MKIFLVFLAICICSQCKIDSGPSISIKDIQKELEKELNTFQKSLGKDPLSGITFINVDCTKTDSLLLDAYVTDQNSRKGIDTGIADVDGKNQNTVVSILEKCDGPISKKSIEHLWYILQHSNADLLTLYYPRIKEFQRAGLIDDPSMALMEDRLLMFYKRPQIYGSQVVKNKLHDLKYPNQLNDLRKSMNLEPIETYTKRFGFEFNLEDYQNK